MRRTRANGTTGEDTQLQWSQLTLTTHTGTPTDISHVEQPTESSQVYKVRAIIIPLVQMILRLERLSILINNPWSPHARTGLKHTSV